ncbi:MAG: GNAT family N-acetyltransferase [Pyrinomonadaceae bacterium]|nr:GNAT family N-acetyltransferase [Pyrinomonadaceae bacterium]
MEVKIIPATPEEESVLANLFELYAHDFSEFSGLEIGEDGRFGYPHLHLYWKEPHRRPFLIRADGKLAGFVLLQKRSQISGDRDVWDIAEFFILRSYRRLGCGMKAAHAVWRMLSGRWEVRVMEQNRGAKEFWQRCVNEFTGRTIDAVIFDKGGKRWHVFSFQA